MEEQKISGNGKIKDNENNMLFNMDTGQMEPKKTEQPLQGITEEDEKDD